jgi:hypothetical protein
MKLSTIALYTKCVVFDDVELRARARDSGLRAHPRSTVRATNVMWFYGLTLNILPWTFVINRFH